jgi:hypothetical protein
VAENAAISEDDSGDDEQAPPAQIASSGSDTDDSEPDSEPDPDSQMRRGARPAQRVKKRNGTSSGRPGRGATAHGRQVAMGASIGICVLKHDGDDADSRFRMQAVHGTRCHAPLAVCTSCVRGGSIKNDRTGLVTKGENAK